MDIETLGVHESVSAVFPPTKLEAALAEAAADNGVSVRVVDDEGVAACEAVVTFAYIEAYDDLEWVHTIQAGYDRFPLERFRERGVTLTNSTGIHGTTVGESALAMMLALARRLHRHVANQQDREWVRLDWDDAFTVFDERCCVVGLGTLGRGVATRADGVGMTVVGVRRTPAVPPTVREVYTPDRLLEAVADARFVVVTTPLTPETEGLIDAEAFAAMREDAYLVNVARGAVVDESALVDALDDGEIAGAALDVFEEEPLPEESPLWGHEDVIVSPHNAGWTAEYYEDVARLVRASVHNLASGEDPVNVVV
ncbi:MAG: D-2-hydroxyacid dehydrogenase [Halobacteriaceae archaeon]